MTVRRISIGRSKDCDIVLADESVSRRHAELLIDGQGNLTIADRQSSRGTYLVQNNRARQVTTTAVNPGDRIRFGEIEFSASELIEAAGGVPPQKATPAGGSAPKTPSPNVAPARVPREDAAPPSAAPRGGKRVRCGCGSIKVAGQPCPDCGAQ